MTKSALWQQLATYPAQLDRQLIASKWPIPGALVGMAVTVSAGRVLNIAPGSFVVALGAGTGSALCVSDAIETATFAAPPGAGSSRIDLLVVQVHDMALDAGGANGFTFDVVAGVPAASPAIPATPARAGVLAYVTSVGGQANLAQSNVLVGDIASAPFGAVNLAGGASLGNSNIPVPGVAPTTKGMGYTSPNFQIQHAGMYVATYNLALTGTGGNPASAYWALQILYTPPGGVGGNISYGYNTGNLLGPYPTLTTSDMFSAAPGGQVTPYINGGGMTGAVAITAGKFTLIRVA